MLRGCYQDFLGIWYLEFFGQKWLEFSHDLSFLVTLKKKPGHLLPSLVQSGAQKIEDILMGIKELMDMVKYPLLT